MKESGLPCLSWSDTCQCCVDLTRAPKEAYSMTDPWRRARISSEMYEEMANLQSLYKRAGRSFSDGPSSASEVPCHTARQGPTRPPSVASAIPNYPPREDRRATGRGNSSYVLSHRGVLTVVPRGRVDHREYQQMGEVELGAHPPMDSRANPMLWVSLTA